MKRCTRDYARISTHQPAICKVVKHRAMRINKGMGLICMATSLFVILNYGWRR